MLDICREEVDDAGPQEGREEALINGYANKLAELLSSLVAPITQVGEKRALLRKALTIEENVRRFRREKTRHEMSVADEEHQYHNVIIPSVQHFLTSAKQAYEHLREAARRQ